MKCRFCGHVLEDGSVFCANCGRKLSPDDIIREDELTQAADTDEIKETAENAGDTAEVTQEESVETDSGKDDNSQPENTEQTDTSVRESQLPALVANSVIATQAAPAGPISYAVAQPVKSSKGKKIIVSVIGAATVIAAAVLIVLLVIIPSNNYKKAMAAADAGKYKQAIELFNKYPNYKDSAYQIKLNKAKSLLAKKEYDDAYKILESIDENDMISESKYSRAKELYDDSKYLEAIELYEEISDYKDSEDKIAECKLEFKKACVSEADTVNDYIITVGSMLEDIGNEIKTSWTAYVFSRTYRGVRYWSVDSAVSAAERYMSSDISSVKSYNSVISTEVSSLKSSLSALEDTDLAQIRSKLNSAYEAYLDLYDCVMDPEGNYITWTDSFSSCDSAAASAIKSLDSAINSVTYEKSKSSDSKDEPKTEADIDSGETTAAVNKDSVSAELSKYEGKLVKDGRNYKISLQYSDSKINYRSSPKVVKKGEKGYNVLGQLKDGTEIKVEYIYDGTWAVFKKDKKYVFVSLYNNNDPTDYKLMYPAESNADESFNVIDGGDRIKEA